MPADNVSVVITFLSEGDTHLGFMNKVVSIKNLKWCEPTAALEAESLERETHLTQHRDTHSQGLAIPGRTTCTLDLYPYIEAVVVTVLNWHCNLICYLVICRGCPSGGNADLSSDAHHVSVQTTPGTV